LNRQNIYIAARPKSQSLRFKSPEILDLHTVFWNFPQHVTQYIHNR